MSYTVHAIRGTKPTKKDPSIEKKTATEVLAEFLDHTRYDVVAVVPQGFGGYLVITRNGVFK